MQQEEQLIHDNMGLIVSLAKSFNPPSETELEEYVQLGRIGLLKAIRYFEPERGYSLTTLAWKCIRQEILGYCRKRDRHNALVPCSIPDNFDYEDTYDRTHLRQLHESLPDTLTEQERMVLKLKADGHSWKAIGTMMGDFSKAWASTVIKRITKKIEQSEKKTNTNV